MSITVMEIILLIVSAIGFVVSFLIPEEEKGSGLNEELAQAEIKELVKQEMESIRGHVEEVVEESMSYAMEKTERSLERLSNEKIMAVSEYSDTVMQEIHKNHEEVMFLYDMLNSKHETLKKTVTEASKAAKAMQDSVESFQTFRPVEVSCGDGSVRIAPLASKVAGNSTEETSPAPTIETPQVEEHVEEPVKKPKKNIRKLLQEGAAPVQPAAETVQEQSEAAETVAQVQLGGDPNRNSNDKILELHRQGKSNVAIAKELGLGVGEVKLVIDLYKNL